MLIIPLIDNKHSMADKCDLWYIIIYQLSKKYEALSGRFFLFEYSGENAKIKEMIIDHGI